MLQANNFEFSNARTSIQYSSSGIDGKPHLHYKKDYFMKSFTGQEIRQQETEIGTLISVTLQATVDAGRTDISLLIPRINIPQGKSKVALKTPVIETKIRSSLGGPNLISGAIQTYTTIQLKGYASEVLF